MPGEIDEATGGYRQTGTQADGLYANQHQAELARDDALYGKGGGGGRGGGDAMGGIMGIMIKLFMLLVIFGPIVLAKVYGFLFGILSHAGKIGRVAQAFVFQFLPIGLMVMAASHSAIKGLISDFRPAAIIVVALAALLNLMCLGIAFWFYHSYYFTVRAMGVTVFSAMIKKVAMIIWFCCLGGGILTLLNPVVGGVIIAGGFVAAIIYFIKLNKEHSGAAKELKKAEPVSPMSTLVLMIVVLAINGAIPGLLGIPAGIKQIAYNIERAAKDKADAAVLNSPLAGSVFLVSNSNANLRADSNSNSRIIKDLNVGDNLNITGENKGLWVPVSFEGENGWVFGAYGMSPATAGSRDIPIWNRMKITVPFSATYDGSDVVVSSVTAGSSYTAFYIWKDSNIGEIRGEDIENINYIGNWGSTTLPASLNKKTPFQATVTKTLIAREETGTGSIQSQPRITLQEGSVVTITKFATDSDDIYNAVFFTYDGKEYRADYNLNFKAN